MGTVKKYNPETGKWEIYGSTDAKDINLLDVGDNFEEKNVESAFREVSDKLNRTLAELESQKSTLVTHASKIEWLKENGGGGGGNTGAAAPTITSTFENCTVDKETEIKIPIFFSSPNLGEGTAYVIVNNVEVASIPGIKQGNNTINIGKMTESRNEVSIYVKDRVNLLSNQLTWIITSGGIELSIDFDDTADYFISDLITMQYYVTTASDAPLTTYLTIDYDTYEIPCKNGFNEYDFPALGIGVHKISMYVSDGAYISPVHNFNVVVVNSNSLYVSSTFKGGEFPMGTPVAIQYRVSKASNESFDVKLYLNGRLNKTLSCVPGAYYWTLNDLDIDHYTVKIEVSGAYDEPQTIELEFDVIASDYNPVKITESGLLYRLSAKGRTNQDSDREYPIDDSGNNVVTKLHNFNFFSNGWVDGELVFDGDAYAEIDLYPYKDNALYGSTIEIQYCALDIGFSDARIFDYTGIETPFKGAYIDIEKISMKSLTNSIELAADKDRYITVSYVIDRRTKFAKIFVDGICTTAFYLSDTGSGTSAKREDFTHEQKIYLNSKKGVSNFGACKIKDIRVYGRALTDEEIVTNFIAQESNLVEQEKLFNFNFDNKTLPVVRMYGDTSNMTLETPVPLRIKYTSPDEDKYGQSFDLPYCQVNWQGTSSLQYVLKNFTVRLKDENMAPFYYSPYPNGILEDTFCFKCDYMESTHSRNVGIAKFVNECLYDSKNPMQLKDPKIRNTVNGFPVLMYINDELQGVYNFNLDRYSTKSFGYIDPDTCLVYEVSANSDTTAGAFFKWNETSGVDKLTYYKSDFECLYPPTRAAGNDNMTELIRLIEWVNDSSDEDFKDNFERYFNKEYVLRYYLYVLVFGAVDSLGKNMKLATWDGLVWYPQVYDADTSIGLDNTGFLKFDMDIEMGDLHVFNTTGSVLWRRVVELFQDELKAQYALMRLDRFTVDNIMKYVYGEQISKIPATFYNKDMQTKYLNFEDDFLIALHGSGEHHIRKWIRERIVYCDSLLGYMVEFDKDKFTLRSSKLGEVYIDIQTYIPMYVTILWRNDESGRSRQTKRVGRGETVRFTYEMPTATDQEIIIYGGYYVKKLGDLSNLEPTYMLIKNASRLTEIECHSPNLIVTDLADCKLLQKIDVSNSPAFGTAGATVNVANCKYLKYMDCRGTNLTAIYTMQSGGNLREIYYPESIQSINLTNQAYLEVAAIPYETDENGQVIKYCENLAEVEINNCRNIKHLRYPYEEGEELTLDPIKQVQNLRLITSLDELDSLSFQGFNKLKTLTLSSMHYIKSLGFDDMLGVEEEAILENITIVDCPLIDSVSFNVSSNLKKVAFGKNSVVDLSGVQSIKTISSNASVKGLNVLKIPTSTKELIFTADYGDGKNEIMNIWSGTANHAADDFVGMDLLDVNLTYLDMGKLSSITNAINFNISPTTQNPNMNTYRTKDFFRPQGRLDLSNYTGDMTYMLKGVDLALLDVVVEKDNRPQQELIGVFEKAIIPADKLEVVNNLLEKFSNATNWTNLFKDSDLDLKPSQIFIPDNRDINLTGMFYNTKINEDIVLPSNVSSAVDMFRDCKNIKTYKNNWERLFPDTFTADKCYWGTGGNLEIVPVPWGGYGFFDNVTSEIIIVVPRANYEVTLGNRYRTLSYGIVNWGDGVIEDLKNVNYRHIYANPGTYTVKGHYTFGKEYICATNLNSILTEVKRIASESVNLNQAFKYCSKLTKVNLNGLTPTTAKEVFSSCTSLTEIIMDTFDASEINTTYGLFSGCSSLTELDLSNWGMNNVTNMGYMFNGCTKLNNLNTNGWNTGNVTNMEYMFSNCSKLTSLNVSHFNTSLVSSMANMFYNCQSLTELDVSSFDTSSCITLANMFAACKKLLYLNVSGFTNDNVTTIEAMFNGCNSMIGIRLDNFGTGKVQNMNSLFNGCEKIAILDLSSFDTKETTNMTNMFYGCKALAELDVSNFDTTNVEDMSYMFAYCLVLPVLDVSSFITSKVKSTVAMFYDCRMLSELDISNFDMINVTDMKYMFYNCYNLLTLNLAGFKTTNALDMNGMFSGCKLLSELDVSKFEMDLVKSTSYMFYDCESLQSLNTSNWNTQSLEDMSYMFADCTSLMNLDVSKFIVAGVKNMSHLFDNCTSLIELDVSKWSTGNVTNMDYLFNCCEKLTTLDVGNFITDKVTSMKYTFSGCFGLTRLYLSNFNVENVESMDSIFYGNTGLVELDLTDWNTSKVQNMNAMFHSCESLLSLDISSFNTSKVTSMKNMFNGCINLADLDLTNFITSNVSDMSHMFSNCRSLPLLDLNHFDTSKLSTVSYMFRYCTCPIVFTNKTNPNLTSTNYMFYDYLGTNIDLTGFSIRKSTKNEYVIKAPNLVDLIAPSDITNNFQILADSLSIESLMSIIDNLSYVAVNQELEIGSRNIAKLSNEQIAVAVNKNWTVC